MRLPIQPKLNVNGNTDLALKIAIGLALRHSDGKTIKSFKIDPKGLIFYDYENPTAVSYPSPPTNSALIVQINNYLKNLSRAEIEDLIGPEPDVENPVSLGWELFDPLWYDQPLMYSRDAFLVVRPYWVVCKNKNQEGGV